MSEKNTNIRKPHAAAGLKDEARRLESFASGVSKESERTIGQAPSSDGARKKVAAARHGAAALTSTARTAKDAVSRATRRGLEQAEERSGLRPADEADGPEAPGMGTGPRPASLSDAVASRPTALRKAGRAAGRGLTDRLNDEVSSAVVGDRESTLYAASKENTALSFLSNAGGGRAAQVARAAKRLRSGKARARDIESDHAAAKAASRLASSDRARARLAVEQGQDADEVKAKLKKRASRRVTDYLRSTISAGNTVTGHGLAMRLSSAVRALLKTTAHALTAAAGGLASALAPVAAPLALVGLLLVFMFSGGWDSVSRGKGTITIPGSYGDGGFTITCYDWFDGRWASGTGQEDVCRRWHEAGSAYTDGIATIEGRYLIACTSKFGSVGDKIDFYLDDGTKIPCIMADEKSQNDAGCNEWGHNDGHNVLEFEVLSDYYHSYGNPGGGGWKDEWGGKRVASATNLTSGGASDGSTDAAVTVPEGTSAETEEFVNRALSVIGSAYSYSGYEWTGSTSTSWFTCSGLVDYAAGLESHSNWPEKLYGEVANLTQDVSALKYGDLVFYEYAGRYPGHVGIYIGDGRIVDAEPSGGVQIRDVNYPGQFLGGGTWPNIGGGSGSGSSSGGGWDWWTS